MSDVIEIQPVGPINATVRPPGSKSITNRALICAALAQGTSRIIGALDSEDTRVMVAALERLGVRIAADWESATLVVDGSSGCIPAKEAELYIANSGTSVRFLSAMVSFGHGSFRLDGTERMRQRPIRDLLDALRQLGVDAADVNGNGCPPVLIRAAGVAGGTSHVRGDVSSQFLSGLLMSAPAAEGALEIIVEGSLVSQPYINLTLDVMRAFSVDPKQEGLRRFSIPAGSRYQGRAYEIEPDASAASYFFGAAAITQGTVTVQGLSKNSLQGDIRFCDVLEQMGCQIVYGDDSITVTGRPLAGVDVDMNAISDTVQTLSAVALFAKGPTRIRGVAHIRHKETDRIGALVTELRKFGADVDETDDGLTIDAEDLTGATVDTYDDHRMAMSLALVGLKVQGVAISDPDCVAKTYPNYFDDLATACRQG